MLDESVADPQCFDKLRIAKLALSGSAMNHYSANVRTHFLNPQNVGDLVEATTVGRGGSTICGATLRISLRIDDAQRISDARFKAAGCAFLIATASQLTGEITGLTTGEASVVAQTREAMARESPGDFPADRDHCATLACETVIAAIRSYSDSARDSWSGDDALICTCFCVSEATIEAVIRDQQLRTIAEVTKACRAGGGCRSCYSLIDDILAAGMQV
jgi:NifU-like protein